MRPVNFGVRYTEYVFIQAKQAKETMMKLNMGWCLGIMAWLPLWAQASYVESCEITGKVLQDSSTRTAYINGPQGEYEVSDLSVSLRIQKVQPHGRADSQCAAFKLRTSLKINISPVPRLAVKQGQQVRLHNLKNTIKGKKRLSRINCYSHEHQCLQHKRPVNLYRPLVCVYVADFASLRWFA